MIIKLAIDPMSIPLLLAAGSASRRVLGAAVGNQLHDIGHFMTSKSNILGKAIQKASLADTIIAAKKGSEGKIWANRKLLPSLFFGEQEGKTIASMGANVTSGSIPKSKYLFKGNKLQVNRLKNVLGTARVIDRGALAGQVAAPTYLGYRDFKHEYDNSHDMGKAIKHGLGGVAIGGLIAGGLELPRRLAGGASQLHKHLRADNNYGYGLLEGASKAAETSMNRPKMFNYSNHFYKTPEENAKGWTGKILGDNFKGLLGQKRMKGYDKIKGYHYGEDENKGFITNILDKADEYKQRAVKRFAK